MINRTIHTKFFPNSSIRNSPPHNLIKSFLLIAATLPKHTRPKPKHCSHQGNPGTASKLIPIHLNTSYVIQACQFLQTHIRNRPHHHCSSILHTSHRMSEPHGTLQDIECTPATDNRNQQLFLLSN